MKLDIWDTYGERYNQPPMSNFYTYQDAFIVVYSVISPYSYRDVDWYMEHIAQKCSEKDVLKFLVGNKCDLEEERRITYEDLLDKAEEHKCNGSFETSTTLEFRSTLDDLLQKVIEQLAGRIE